MNRIRLHCSFRQLK